jgi:hypothetical protein
VQEDHRGRPDAVVRVGTLEPGTQGQLARAELDTVTSVGGLGAVAFAGAGPTRTSFVWKAARAPR